MANTFYYGTSDTPADSTVKQVIIQGLPADIRDESFLQLGDMISVYFQYGNSEEHPSIKLYNGSIDNEIAVSDDNGHRIKTQQLNNSIAEAWGNGDTCSFFYTQINTVSDTIYYWTLAVDSIASEGEYGKVKLANDISNLSEADKATTAITVQAAQALIAAQPIGQLDYLDAVTGNKVQIGTLTYTNGDDTPIEKPIYVPPTPSTLTHTHELINDGEGEDKFITRNLDTTLSFIGEDKGITIYDEEDEMEYLLYEPVDINNNATIRSLHDFNINAINDINIEAANDLKVSATNNIILNKNILYTLDIIIDSDTGVATGEDKELYDLIKELGWNEVLQG